MPIDVLACLRSASLATALKTAAAVDGHTVALFSAAAVQDAVAYLVLQQPRLIVLETAALPAWRAFVATAKTSPATRRMPLLLLLSAPDADTERAARAAGCNAVLAADIFVDTARAVIAENLRPDLSAEIARQALLSLPDLAHKAIEQFNAGEYWEQHETFETVWRAESGPIRQLYQSILQIGVAYLQIQRKNYIGARKIFQRAQQYLAVLPDVAQGIDVAQLRRDAAAAMIELERLGPEHIAAFPSALFKPIIHVNR